MSKQKEAFKKAMGLLTKTEITDMFADFVFTSDRTFYGRYMEIKSDELRFALVNLVEKRLQKNLDEQKKMNPFKDIKNKSEKEIRDAIRKIESLRKEYKRLDEIFNGLL